MILLIVAIAYCCGYATRLVQSRLDIDHTVRRMATGRRVRGRLKVLRGDKPDPPKAA